MPVGTPQIKEAPLKVSSQKTVNQAPGLLPLEKNAQDGPVWWFRLQGEGSSRVFVFPGSRNHRASSAVWWQRGELLFRVVPITRGQSLGDFGLLVAFRPGGQSGEWTYMV